MVAIKRYRWGAISLSMATDQGLSLARFGGVLVPEAAREWAEVFAGRLLQSQAAASVVDYREARTALQVARLGRPLRQVAREAQTAAIPTALVVKRDELEVWAAHAERMRESGLMRAAFVDAEKARQWAAEMAALYAAQANYRRERE